MLNLHAWMFIGWLMLVTSWTFYRHPDIPLLSSCWRPWRPSDYVTEQGVKLWAIGSLIFFGSFVLSLR